MAKRRIDWLQLKSSYIYGEVESVRAFLASQEVAINGFVSRKVKGWRQEREDYRAKLEAESQRKTIIKVSESEADIRARQAKLARLMQAKAIEGLSHSTPHTFSQFLNLMKTGLEQERKAYGFDKNKTVNPPQTIDELPIMQTEYGRAIQTMDVGELTQVLARLVELGMPN